MDVDRGDILNFKYRPGWLVGERILRWKLVVEVMDGDVREVAV